VAKVATSALEGDKYLRFRFNCQTATGDNTDNSKTENSIENNNRYSESVLRIDNAF
jgi:hypothetical protein